MLIRTLYLAGLLLLLPASLFAAEGVANIQNLTPGLSFSSLSDSSAPFLGGIFQANDIPGLLNSLFKTAIVVGGILAVLRFSYAGFIYMTTDLWPSKTGAKQILEDTFYGLVLLVAVWLILNQINPQILELEILKNISPVDPSAVEGRR